MKKLMASLGSIVFLVLAPGTVAGLVPWFLSRWRFDMPFFGAVSLRAAGWFLLTAALWVLLESFGRFALLGEGTPAPVFPTRRLVVTGFYRHVRNPMYVAVVAAILGQSLIFGNVPILAYAVLIWLAFHLFIIGYEEPNLRRQFPGDYVVYFANVPRWLPRLTPWRAS